MFEKASRLKLRFDYNGPCASTASFRIDDLWTLSIVVVNDVLNGLKKRVRELKEEYPLHEETPNDKFLSFKIDILKYIINVKQREQLEKETKGN